MIIERVVNKVAKSKRVLMLSIISCLILFVFLWQGVESMVNGVSNQQNTFFRVFILCLFLGFFVAMALYIWTKNIYGKMEVAVEYAKTVHESVAIDINADYEERCKELFAEMEEKAEQYEFLKSRYEKLIQQKVQGKSNEVSIPIDYSLPRNRIVFIKQNGANGQTAYEYAYYEVAGNMLIIGKANFTRTLHSTEHKRDSLNRMIGTEDVFTCEYITVYKQLEMKLSEIPEPYKTAIQLGAMKTDTVISLAKKWGKDKIQEPEIVTVPLPIVVEKKEEAIQAEEGDTIEIKLL